MKEKIEDIIVVEGVHDVQKIQSIFDVDVLYTNGSAVSSAFIDKLKCLSETRSIIIFTDPDFPGKKIRQTIMQAIPNVKHAFIDKQLALGKGKVGVEHASVADIKSALANVITPQNQGEILQKITWTDLLTLDLVVGSQAKQKRQYISSKLHFGHVNGKQFYKSLELFGVSKERLMEVMEEFEYEKSSNME